MTGGQGSYKVTMTEYRIHWGGAFEPNSHWAPEQERTAKVTHPTAHCFINATVPRERRD